MKLLAIDGNSILNRAYYGVRPLTTREGIHTNAVYGFVNIFLRLVKKLSPDAVAVAFDVSRTTFRNEKYELYKANRTGMPDDLREQLPLVKELLCLMGHCPVGLEGYEGDDILGTLAKHCASGDECIIATGDRDCLQLVSDNVSVLLVKTKEDVLCTADNMKSEIGYLPCDVIELKALMGDSSDNIPGVKGIGEKTAQSLIDKYHTIDEIYENIGGIDATPRIKKLLEEGKDSAFMSRELATICCDAPIDYSIESYKKKQADSEGLRALMTKLEMFSLFERLNLDAASASQLPSEIEKKQIFIFENASAEQIAAALKGSDKVYLIYSNTLSLQVNGSVYAASEEACDAVLKYIIQNKLKVYTFMAKPLIKKLKALGAEEIALEFDVELAAYLLSPSAKGYEIDILAAKYCADVSLDVGGEHFAAAILPYICESLAKELEKEGMGELYRTIELPLCEVLSDMEMEGFAVDTEGLSEFGKRMDSDIALITEQIYEQAGEHFNINSTRELGAVLFEKLGLPAKKKTKTGYSTGIEVLEELYSKHEIIPLIIEYRKLTKLQSTYVVGLLKAVGEDSRVHSTFNQTETRTGRISSTEPNVQNIPVRTVLGSEIRKFFVAREGYLLIDADYSQIELRILAHIAEDKNMIDAFLHGDDIHAITASQVFECPLSEMTPTLRSRAKAINFGIVYGIGAYSLSQDINVSVAEAKAYIEAYLRTYSGVSRYMERIIRQADEQGAVRTLYGRKRELAEIHSTNKLIKGFAERVARNTPIQGTAADIIKLAMIKAHKRLKNEGFEARLILQVHDELIIEAPAMQAEHIKTLLKEEMENAASLAVPLLVDVHSGKDWYTAKG